LAVFDDDGHLFFDFDSRAFDRWRYRFILKDVRDPFQAIDNVIDPKDPARQSNAYREKKDEHNNKNDSDACCS